MKVILVASGVFFFWFFFHRTRSLLGIFTFHIANELLAWLLWVVRALLFGYIVYALVAVYGSIGSISTFTDVITILCARPSQVGGPGIVGVILGILVAMVTYNSPIVMGQSNGGMMQGRRVVSQTIWRRTSFFIFRSVRSVATSMKKRRDRS